MKRKWLAVFLACLLLLCGCKTMETVPSMDNEAATVQKTVGTTTSASTKTALGTTAHTSTKTNVDTIADSTLQTINTTVNSYNQGRRWYKTKSAYEKIIRGLHSQKDLENVFMIDSGLIADMPMFLVDKFYLWPSTNANLLPQYHLDPRGYSEFLVVLEDDCENCNGDGTIDIIIRHDKNSITDYNTTWLQGEKYTTASGLEIVPYDTGYRNGRFCITQAYGYAISLHISTYCDCAKAVMDTLSFKKVEIK